MSFHLPTEIRSIIRCSDCQADLDENTSGLICPGCAAKFPRVNGVLRFVDAEKYGVSFGYQWTTYARTQLDDAKSHESETDFRNRTGWGPEDLRGKLVLDVGCGMGRFADIASRWGARVVGIDLSAAAEVAAKNLADRQNTTIFQADIFSLPFAPESFDYIYSLGVLHHTPNCERAFKVLPKLLKPGGSIAIWLYSGYNKWYRFSDLYRRVTHRIPRKSLRTLCHVAVPLYYVHSALRRVPVAGRPASALLYQLLPVSLHPNAEMRVLDTFDWYSPSYQSKHTYEEVFRWFESCGLESLRVLNESVSVRGVRPVGGKARHAREEISLASQAS
ncbi:MAG TPA: class I SAM-dependent methyltransferase [Terriglobales bacterium]